MHVTVPNLTFGPFCNPKTCAPTFNEKVQSPLFLLTVQLNVSVPDLMIFGADSHTGQKYKVSNLREAFQTTFTLLLLVLIINEAQLIDYRPQSGQ